MLLFPGRHIEARSFYTYYLRTLTGITRGSYKLNATASSPNDSDRVSHPLRADRSEPPPAGQTGAGRARGWHLGKALGFGRISPVADGASCCAALPSSKLYMADLESALHYSLRVEAARPSSLSGAQLAAFKCYVATLVKVRSSGCWQGNCLCLHLSVCEVQTVQATVPQHSRVVKCGCLVWALCSGARCIPWQSSSMGISKLSPESQPELRVFQTRWVLPVLVAVGSSPVGGVEAGGLFRREAVTCWAVRDGHRGLSLDAQLKEPISAGSFDNSPGKELPL